jgi:hypothetical protein
MPTSTCTSRHSRCPPCRRAPRSRGAWSTWTTRKREGKRKRRRVAGTQAERTWTWSQGGRAWTSCRSGAWLRLDAALSAAAASPTRAVQLAMLTCGQMAILTQAATAKVGTCITFSDISKRMDAEHKHAKRMLRVAFVGCVAMLDLPSICVVAAGPVCAPRPRSPHVNIGNSTSP